MSYSGEITYWGGDPNYYKEPEQGWQCPKCECIYSPWTFECHHCNEPDNFVKDTGTAGYP